MLFRSAASVSVVRRRVILQKSPSVYRKLHSQSQSGLSSARCRGGRWLAAPPEMMQGCDAVDLVDEGQRGRRRSKAAADWALGVAAGLSSARCRGGRWLAAPPETKQGCDAVDLVDEGRRLDNSGEAERPGTDTGKTDLSVCRLDREVGKPRRCVATVEGAGGHEAPMVALHRVKKRRELRSGRRWRARERGEAEAQLCVLCSPAA